MNQPALRNINTVEDTLEKIEALDQIQKRKDVRVEEAEARQNLSVEKDENALDLKVRLKPSSSSFKRRRSGADGAGPTTPTLVGPKIVLFMVKALYFQSSGGTNNCQIKVLFK